MSDTSLKRQLKVLTIPVFIEMALVMMLGAVDTVMLSRYSDNSVAAVGLDNQLISLVFLVYQFFSMGAAILCAQYIGAGLRTRLVQVVGMALAVNMILGLVVSALLFFYRRCGLSFRRWCHLPMERCRRCELRYRHSARFWSCRHVGRLCPRREYPWRYPCAPLAIREMAYERFRQRIISAWVIPHQLH